MKNNIKDIFKIISAPVLIASLCCLSPVILVLFGLSTAAFAGSLADILYGEYKWFFRAAGLVLLAGSLILYLRRQKGVCTLDEIKRRRNEILNFVLVSVITAIIGYMVWLYIIIEYVGKLLHIWK